MAELTKFNTYNAFMEAPLQSMKHSSYFQAYDELFGSYRGKPIVFCEIGVLGGGSLFMWRNYFGPEARIIGIDFNPEAKKYESHGFEIFIGDQTDPDFWHSFFEEVGSVDLLLDDGAHNNLSMANTLFAALPKISDGGTMVFEDVHTSYVTSFGNPSKNSFISVAFDIIDRINYRSSQIKDPRRKPLALNITSVRFFESIVAFSVDHDPIVNSEIITNNGNENEIEDFKFKNLDNQGSLSMIQSISLLIRRFLSKKVGLMSVFKRIYYHFGRYIFRFFWRRENRKVMKLKKYFF